jgi:hypothetical protein
MLKSEVRTISRTITKNDPFTLLATPTMNVVLPDATTTAPTVAVDPTVGTAALSMTMFATFAFSQGGSYLVEWFAGEGVQTIIKRTDIYFAFHTHIYGQVRDEMKLSEAALPDEVIDLMASRIMAGLNASFTTLRAYDQFVLPSEVMAIDEVLVYLICIKLRKMGYMGPPSGELISWQFQQTKFQFQPSGTPGTGSSSMSREDQWFNNAMLVFQKITEIAVIMAARRANYLGFHISGPSRKKAETVAPSPFGTVVSLLTDAINYGAW